MMNEGSEIVEKRMTSGIPAAYEELTRMYPLLTKEQELELAVRARDGDEDARTTLVYSNIRLAVTFAKKYSGGKYQLQNDLIQEAIKGLLRATDYSKETHFDPDKGFRFTTYSTQWIRHYVQRYVYEKSSDVRMPIHMVERIKKIWKFSMELEKTLQREPTHEEIAEASGLPLEQIQQAEMYNRHEVSMDVDLDGSGNGGTMHKLIAEETSEYDEVEIDSQRQLVVDLINRVLPKVRSREVMILRLGLNEDHDIKTLEEIGAIFDVTRERIRQIQNESLKILNIELEDLGLNPIFVSQSEEARYKESSEKTERKDLTGKNPEIDLDKVNGFVDKKEKAPSFVFTSLKDLIERCVLEEGHAKLIMFYSLGLTEDGSPKKIREIADLLELSINSVSEIRKKSCSVIEDVLRGLGTKEHITISFLLALKKQLKSGKKSKGKKVKGKPPIGILKVGASINKGKERGGTSQFEKDDPVDSFSKREISDVVRQLAMDVAKMIDTPLPDGFELRPKQKVFLEKFKEFFESGENTSGFVKYPPGMGKTILMSLIIRALNNLGEKKRVLVLSSRNVINDQNFNTIKKWQDEDIVIKNAFEIENETDADVVISSYSLASMSEGGISDVDFGEFDAILLDECHRSFGEAFNAFIEPKLKESLVVGLSATPYVGTLTNKKSLKTAFSYFDGEIHSISLREACEDGDLVPVRAHRVEIQSEDLSEVTNDKDLRKKLDTTARTSLVMQLFESTIPRGEPSIIFCKSVQHSKEVATALDSLGIKVAHVDGKMNKDTVKKIREDFYNGKIDVVTNAEILTEGYDNEKIKHVIMLTATHSLWKYEQCIGRGGRLDINDPNKILNVWDIVGQHAGHCTIHGLAKFYGDLSDEFENGTLIFAPEKEKQRERLPGQRRKRNEIEWIHDAVIKRFVSVEEVGKVNVSVQEYFNNFERVTTDLQKFAKGSGVSIADLNSGEKYRKVRVMTEIGDITFHSWLQRWAEVTGVYSKDLLIEMKDLLGVKLSTATPALFAYFDDSAKVERDLALFAKNAGVEISDLDTKAKYNTIAAQTEIGGLTFRSWVTRYAKLIDLPRGQALHSLKVKIGVIDDGDKNFSMTKDSADNYFADSGKVIDDLVLFSKALGIEVEDLTTNTGRGEKVQISLGSISFRAFIARYQKYRSISYQEALEDLKGKYNKIRPYPADLAQEKVIMAKEYFTDEQIDLDLNTYLDESGLSKLSDMALYKYGEVISTLGNGERMSFGEWIYRYKKHVKPDSSLWYIAAKLINNKEDVSKLENETFGILEAFAKELNCKVYDVSFSKNNVAVEITYKGVKIILESFLKKFSRIFKISESDIIKEFSSYRKKRNVETNSAVKLKDNYFSDKNIQTDFAQLAAFRHCPVKRLEYHRVTRTEIYTCQGEYLSVNQIIGNYRRIYKMDESVPAADIFEKLKDTALKKYNT